MNTFATRGVLALIGAVVLTSPFIFDPASAHAQPLGAIPAGVLTAADDSTAPEGTEARGKNQDGRAIYGEIGYQILSLFAWFTGIAGVLLNAAVYYTVVQMASFVDNMGAIVVAWKVLRDVGNIILIFGFIAIGLATILDIQSYNAKKMLVRLIIVAVTVNFSLFAARAIIDVGNVFAYQFYAQMADVNKINSDQANVALFDTTNEGVSNAIMGMIGLQTFYVSDSASSKTIKMLSNNALVAFIFGSMLFIVAAFVLFALAFMLIARFVILVFLMILSPVGFVGLIVPNMEGLAEKWWSTLIAQSAVAPVLLLMVLISVTLMTTGQGGGVFGNTGGQSFGAAFDLEATDSQWIGTANMILGFLISMGLLMASLIIAKQAGAFGASFAIGASRRLTSLALSPVRVVGRETVGRGAAALNKRYEKMIGGNPKALAVLRALNVDQGLTKGFAAVSKDFNDRKKADKERADHVGHAAHSTEVRNKLNKAIASNPGAVSGLLRGMNKTELREYLQDAKSSERAAVAEALSAKQYADLIDDDKVGSDVRYDLESGRYRKSRDAIGNQADVTQAMRDSVRALAVSDLERMPGEELLDPRLVQALSEAQVEKLIEAANNNVSAVTKDRIRELRNARFTNKTTTEAAFPHMSAKEIAGIDGTILAQNHVYTSIQDASTYATVLQTAKMSTSQKSTLVQRANDIIDGTAAEVPASVRAQFVARLADPTFANELGRKSAPIATYLVPHP